jgi:aspartyl aminopeptidase
MAAARAELAVAAGKFIDSTPTPFHLCAQGAALLRSAGFVELVETEAWRPLLKPGGNYFYVRGGTLVAFAVGAGFVAGGGFSIVGAHTDSPVLKLKPCSKKSVKGYQQIDVEAYGGGLWHTWFDRELSVAGAVIVRQPGGAFQKRLVCVRRPLLRIPNLCIHLQTADERAKFGVNKETHLQPILGMVAEAVNKPAADATADAAAPATGAAAAADVPLEARHAPELLSLLGAELADPYPNPTLTLTQPRPCPQPQP